ncbi:MAG: 50S ribosomal protein L18 [Kiritimatiellaeota bacterium]|nr:50S ribosomal protein L18 [Kiritimatiellota bacterium]
MKRNRKEQRQIRHQRIRQKISGTAARPRMAIAISNAHIYVQFVDDVAHRTLAHVTSVGMGAKLNVETAKQMGEKAAAAALAAGIVLVVVDRGGFKFHGRVKAIVDAAVASGIKISEKPPRIRPERKTAAEKKPEKKAKEDPAADKKAPKAKKEKSEKEKA